MQKLDDVDLSGLSPSAREMFERDKRDSWLWLIDQATPLTDNLIEIATEKLAANPDDVVLQRIKEGVDRLAEVVPRAIVTAYANLVRGEEMFTMNQKRNLVALQNARGILTAYSHFQFAVSVTEEELLQLMTAPRPTVLVHNKNQPNYYPTIYAHIPRGWSAFELGSSESCCGGSAFGALGDHLRRKVHYSDEKNEPWACVLRELFPHSQCMDCDYEYLLGEYCYRHAAELGFVFLSRTVSYGPYRLMEEADLLV